MATIEFNNQFVPQSLVEIPDIGNFALEAYNEKAGFFYYLMVKTSLGTSTIVSYGPVVPQVNLLPDFYSSNFCRVPFKDMKIKGTIAKWLNDRDKGLTEARIIDDATFFAEIRDLKEYMMCYGEDIY